jgi:hypothetical protein
MFTPCLLALVLAADAEGPVDVHEQLNPVYRSMRQVGVGAGPARWKLPPPTMDTDDPGRQKTVLRSLAGADYDPDELTRHSVAAPFILKIQDLKKSESTDNAYRLDLWFVVYGSPAQFKDTDAEKRIVQLSRSDIRVHFLEAAELTARGISRPAADASRDRYVYAAYTLLDRIQVSLTTRHFLSRTDSSVTIAGVSDQRFAQDKLYPNQWRRIDKEQDPPSLGPVEPYPYQIGYYQRVTRLVEPAGALLVEYHAIFVEPAAWFRGTSLLRSKLPLLIQSEVRTFRRELARAQ